jgi:hypothetical protein
MELMTQMYVLNPDLSTCMKYSICVHGYDFSFTVPSAIHNCRVLGVVFDHETVVRWEIYIGRRSSAVVVIKLGIICFGDGGYWIGNKYYMSYSKLFTFHVLISSACNRTESCKFECTLNTIQTLHLSTSTSTHLPPPESPSPDSPCPHSRASSAPGNY